MATPLTRREWLAECEKLVKVYEDAMTDPNHTDTSRSNLVERIEGCIANAEHDDEWETLIDARDRIEALEAEIEGLRREDWFEQFEEQEQLRDNAEQRLSVVEAENERLRGALVQIRDRKWNTMTQGCDAACEAAQIARAALGEKQ